MKSVRRDRYWQNRVLPERKALTVRAKLGWTLFLLALLAFLPMIGSTLAIRSARDRLTEVIAPELEFEIEAAQAENWLVRARRARRGLTLAHPLPDDRAAGKFGALAESLAAHLSRLGRSRETGSRGEPTAARWAERYRETSRALLEERSRAEPPANLDSLSLRISGLEGSIDSLLSEASAAAHLAHAAGRRAAERGLSLAARDLISVSAIALAVALFVLLSAPRWILSPIHRLTRFVRLAEDGHPVDVGRFSPGNDEIGRLIRFFAGHLERDRVLEAVRARHYRRSRDRMEALLEEIGAVGAGISPGGRVWYASRGLIRALDFDRTIAGEPDLSRFWPDPALAQGLEAMRRSGDHEAKIGLLREPFTGRTARLIRIPGGDAKEVETLILVPDDRSHDHRRPGEPEDR